MIGEIANTKPDQIQLIRLDTLLRKLALPKLEDLLRANSLRCFGHVERSDESRFINVTSEKKAGHPQKTWQKTIRRYLENEPEDCQKTSNP